MVRAIEYFRGGLAGLGQVIPRSDGVLLPMLVLGTGDSGVPYAHAADFLHRRKRTPSETELLTVRLFNGLTLAYWYGRGTHVSLWSHLREMNLAERYPPTLELAHAYSEHAPAMGVISGFSRGLISGCRRGMAYGAKSLDIRRSFGDVGERPVAPLLGNPALRAIAVLGMHRRVSGSGPVARADRDYCGGPYGSLSDRCLALSTWATCGGRSRNPAELSIRTGAGGRAGSGHHSGRVVARGGGGVIPRNILERSWPGAEQARRASRRSCWPRAPADRCRRDRRGGGSVWSGRSR